LDCPGIVRIAGVTRKPTLGVVNIAYVHLDFIPWTEPIPKDHLPRLLLNLLRIIDYLHQRNISHSWICRSSVYVHRDFSSLTLGAFHAAGRVGEPWPFVAIHPCLPKERLTGEDRRPDDVYAAGMWCLGYLEGSEEGNENAGLRKVISKMTVKEAGLRINAADACKELEEL
jgi:hypothetical protein